MDLATVATAILRPGALVGARDERTAFSLRTLGALLDGRLRLADVSPDLAREARAASGQARATLILPAGPGPARIEFGGRQFVIPASVRDALLAALSDAQPGRATPSAAQTNAAARDPNLVVRLPTQALVAPPGAEHSATAAAANTLAASGTLRAARNESARDAAPRAVFEEPVLERGDAAAAAGRIAARVSASGAFFESHVAQWLRGDRSAESVRAEAQQLSRTAAGDPARVDARSALQVETLQRQSIALAGPAWPGQPMFLEIGRDPYALPESVEGTAAAAGQVFAARLAMELPRLGRIEVRLRLAGHAVAATIASDVAARVEEIAAALPEFAAALQARGLHAVLLQAQPAPAEAKS